MKILYIGSGFVGACSAAVAAASGHDVLVYDIDKNRIKALGSGDRDTIESCLFEKGLGDLLVRNSDRVEFMASYDPVEKFLDDCDAVFMCLPTPEIGETGESDLRHYFSASERLSEALAKRNSGSQNKYVVVVNKSTVPIDMLDKTREILDKAGVKNFGLAANPEFLIEGKAVEGSLKPDRVVVGASDDRTFSVMRQIYQRFYDSPAVEYVETSPQEAAAGKLLANFYLFNRLAVCFDVVGRTCEAFPNLKFENIRKILTSDKRIGDWGFYDSLYAGGSCFIKDARSLSHQLQTAGQNAVLVDETYLANRRQLELFLSRAVKEAGFDWAGKTVSLLGLAFKRDTNDTRNAPAVEVAKFLFERSVAKIKAYDPAAMKNFKYDIGNNDKIEYSNNETDTIQNVDVIIIATDWPQFRGVADVLLAGSKRPLIMDGRRMLQHRYEDLQAAGFDIIAVGSQYLKGKK